MRGAELIIHNAEFDMKFLNSEIGQLKGKFGPLTEYCSVVDSLALARQKHPGQKNSLDALCKRYNVDNSGRELHGALLDAEILADVYLLLTGGQVDLGLGDATTGSAEASTIRRLPADRPRLKVIKADIDELSAHEAKLDQLAKAENGCLWRQLELGVQ